MTVPPIDPADSVYLFGTCLIDLFAPEAGLAAMKLLQMAGLRVVFPQSQSCCGQPARNNGFPDEARAVARRQLDSFPENWPIIVPSGSCAGMMKTHYPALFADTDDADRARAFCDRIYELTQFLVDRLDLEWIDHGPPVTVTWHPSCHAQREMGIGDQPKALLRRLSNVNLVELPRETECCGFGGSFAVRQPEISAAMVTDKVTAVDQTGAQTLLSGDCGCLLNIDGAAQHAGKSWRGRHIAEFLLERLKDG